MIRLLYLNIKIDFIYATYTLIIFFYILKFKIIF